MDVFQVSDNLAWEYLSEEDCLDYDGGCRDFLMARLIGPFPGRFRQASRILTIAPSFRMLSSLSRSRTSMKAPGRS